MLFLEKIKEYAFKFTKELDSIYHSYDPLKKYGSHISEEDIEKFLKQNYDN